MDLTSGLLRWAAHRPHVLLVPTPGGTPIRLAVEAELRRRGWPLAATPADADVLLVAGPSTDQFKDVLAAAWDGMPAPRARGHAINIPEIVTVLDAAEDDLTRLNRQQALQIIAQGSNRSGQEQPTSAHGDMQMPGGLPMADRAEDRDGLKLDELHVSLGPVLPDWPAGLVLRVSLHGDVVQEASVDIVGGTETAQSFWTEPWRRAAAGDSVTVSEAARRCAGAHLDSLSRLLAVAGWEAAATSARRLRDRALDGAESSVLQAAVHRIGLRVSRSRMLAWSTRGLGTLSADDASAAGVRGPALRAAGDVTARYRRWCRELAEVADRFDDDRALRPELLEPPRGWLEDVKPPSAALLAVLPGLLAGAELAAARLIVASLDPDLDELAVQVGVEHVG